MTNLLILKHRHGRAFHSLCLRLSLLTAGTNLWKVYKWTLISQTNKVFTLQWLIVRITSPQSLSKFLASGRVPIYSSLSGAFCAIQLRLYAKSRYSLPYKVRLKQIDLLPASWRFSEIHSHIQRLNNRGLKAVIYDIDSSDTVLLQFLLLFFFNKY